MPKCYIAIKLDPMDAMQGRVPEVEQCYPCAVCSDISAAVDYLQNAKAAASYPALAEKLAAPDVDVILTFNSTKQVPEGASDYSTHIMSEMKSGVLSHMISISADKVFPAMSFSSPSYEESQERMGVIMCKRLDVNAQLEKAQAVHKTCDGLQQWFQHIAEFDPECDGLFPEAEDHVQAYVDAYYLKREESPQASNEIVILQAEILAARQVAESHPEWAEEFQCVEAVALDELEQRCAQELTFYEPTDYLTRMLPKVPEAYQDAFLNAFNETFETIQAEHPEWSSEQQSARAMDSAAATMEASITEQQINGIFGQGPKISKDEFRALDAAKHEFINLRAETHTNVELVDQMVSHLRDVRDERNSMDEIEYDD